MLVEHILRVCVVVVIIEKLKKEDRNQIHVIHVAIFIHFIPQIRIAQKKHRTLNEKMTHSCCHHRLQSNQ